jgi:MazG family protein
LFVLTFPAGYSSKGVVLAGENLRKLVALTARLRGPDGCPWDREQNFDSLKGLLLEEAYEVVDAASARDFGGLEDELGDLLFMVLLYTRLAEEEGHFTVDDVIERVHAKLIRRHPHVFGDVQARTAEEALQSWLAAKEKEKEREARPDKSKESNSLLDGIAPHMPATLEAYELSVRAAEVGFDWEKIEDLLDKVEEEVEELRRELKEHPQEKDQRIQGEVGDLLFAAANLARHVRSDPESCLRAANQKFKRRFRALEEEVSRRGKKVRECSLAELESIWTEVKMRFGSS